MKSVRQPQGTSDCKPHATTNITRPRIILTLPADQPADLAELSLHDGQVIFLAINELLALAPDDPLRRGRLELAVPRNKLSLGREDEIGAPCSSAFE